MTDEEQAAPPIPADDSNAPARPRRRLRVLGMVLPSLLLGLAAVEAAVLLDATFVGELPPLPRTDALWAAGRAAGVTFLDVQGRTIGHRGADYGPWVELKDLPAYVPAAFLAIEDRRFYEHHGLDWRGLARAALVDLRTGHATQGGSTLTQQLARTLFLKPEQTFRRKAQELVLAGELEAALGKDDLLELYLNRIYFGDRAYGLSAAAQDYFGKPASQLSLPEAAMLAALPKAPSRLSPATDQDGAWARARLVLAKMVETGAITPAAAAEAAARRPQLRRQDGAPEGAMRWVFDAAQQQARALVGDQVPDIVIKVTVDPALQAEGLQALQDGVAREGRARGARQGALVALDPDGGIRALIGGTDPSAAFDRAIQAQRQPGSAFKPFVYAAALERGVEPYETRSDGFIRVGNWTPENFGGGSRGQVTVAQALQYSLNTVAVRLALEAGVSNVAALARRFGVTSIPEHPGPSVALGAYEVSLLQLTAGYQGLQSGGRLSRPYLVSEVTDGRGQVLYHRPPSGGVPVYNEFKAGQMVRMMEGVIGWGTGRRAAIGRPAAGKTGTSQAFRDAWFVGFTPDWVCGVWIGNADSRPMAGMTGGQLPAEIWRRFMIVAHRGLPVRDFPWAQLPSPSYSAAARDPDGAQEAEPAPDEPVTMQPEESPSRWTQARAEGLSPPWRSERSGEYAPDDQTWSRPEPREWRGRSGGWEGE